ncbi:MAG: AI-2E family transporter [Candidatus Palauibacterales bacterium]|nr:AI-2E family transporter [Candidatus Palauibacterales bacterium]MDP2482706.1 AI-2E family transporter [Candidatus Palauibacterales bacterium]
METNVVENEGGRFLQLSVEAAIRIGMLALIFIWSLSIIRPFTQIVLWGIILAVALYPLYLGLAQRLGGRRKTAAVLITLVALAVLLVPSWRFFSRTIGEAREVAEKAEAGTLQVPPPTEKVREWPLIGERAYGLWSEASRNIAATIERLRPEMASFGKWALRALAGIAGTVLQFLVSIIIAGVLLTSGEKSRAFSVKFASRLAGPQGEEFVRLAVATVRSVFKGVLGIAVIQSALAAVGMLVLGVPGAMIWALLVMICTIIQLPAILVLGPVMVWAFATQSTTAAIIFTVYGLLVSASDGVLKPLLLGRGVDVPMLVILLGAIGGMVMSGIIGLFVGAVVLAVAYQLMMAWVEQDADLGMFSTAGAPVPVEGDA